MSLQSTCMKSYADAFARAPNSAREQKEIIGDTGTLGMLVLNGPGSEDEAKTAEGTHAEASEPCLLPTENCPVRRPSSCQRPQA